MLLGAEARRGLERALLGAAARPTGSATAGASAEPEPEVQEYYPLTLTPTLTPILTQP